MYTYKGFTLVEVLVSLLIVTGISLALLKQQFHIIYLFHQAEQSVQALLIQDNRFELDAMETV